MKVRGLWEMVFQMIWVSRVAVFLDFIFIIIINNNNNNNNDYDNPITDVC